MKPFRVVIPFELGPYSLNETTGRHWGTLRGLKNALEHETFVEARRTLPAGYSKIPTFKRPVVQITCFFPVERLRDQDNYSPVAKAVMDGLVRAGFLTDDNHKAVSLAPIAFGIGPMRIEVNVTEMAAV